MEKLLDSKSKMKLALFFLTHPQRAFFVGEIRKKNLGRNFVSDLAQMVRKEILLAHSKRGKKYYRINKRSEFYESLKDWARKFKRSSEDELVKLAKKFSGLRFAALSGFLTGQNALQCDVLLVGNFKQNQLNNFIDKMQRIVSNEINFAVMSLSEFEYRKNTFDRFMKDIFENEHLVLVDKTAAATRKS